MRNGGEEEEDDDDDEAFVSHEDVDAHLASELQHMTMEARSRLFDEIHGVGTLPPEETSPGLIRECLHRMALALEDIPDKPAYDEALTYPTSFVNNGGDGTTTAGDDNNAYRLSFLRAERFDPRKAAVRMVRMLELLSRYFGPVSLRRFLTFEDLTEEARSFVRCGNLQLLPFRDRAGRMIVMRIGSMGTGVSKQAKVRGLFFMIDRFFWCGGGMVGHLC
jgi:hypothetical protein